MGNVCGAGRTRTAVVLTAATAALLGMMAVLVPSIASGQTAGGLNWNQLGRDIDGEGLGDGSGSSVAMNIGALENDGNGTRSGHVRVYDFNGTDWTQTGSDIDGEAAGDLSGASVAISSDGYRIAYSDLARWEITIAFQAPRLVQNRGNSRY